MEIPQTQSKSSSRIKSDHTKKDKTEKTHTSRRGLTLSGIRTDRSKGSNLGDEI